MAMVFPSNPTDGTQFPASNGAIYQYTSATSRWDLVVAPANSYYTRPQSDAKYLPLSGGTLSGPLTLSGNPTSTLQAATKEYVDSVMVSAGNGTPVDLANYLTILAAKNSYLALSGGVVTGQIASPEPLQSVHLATKHYVDTSVGSALVSLGSAQYLTQNVANTLYAPINATWTISSVTGLAAALNSVLPFGGGTLTGPLYLYEDPLDPTEASTKRYVDANVSTLNTSISARALLQHTHAMSDIQGLDDALANTAPLTATWTISSVTGLQDILNTKINVSDKIPITQVANLSQVISELLPVTGGAMTGPLVLAGDPSQSFEATSKNYVDTSITGAILSLPTSTAIVGTAAPTSPIDGNLWWDSANAILYIYYNDGVTKQFVPTTPTISALGNYIQKTGGSIIGQLQMLAEFDVLDAYATHGLRMRGDATNGGMIEAYNQVTGLRETLALCPNGGIVTVPNATGAGQALNVQTADSRYARLTGATFSGAVSLAAATFAGPVAHLADVTMTNSNINVSNGSVAVDLGSLPMSQGAVHANFVATSDDTGAALALFNRTEAGNASSVFVGLDSDNVFKVGGGAWPVDTLTLDATGNMGVAGALSADSIFCESDITNARLGFFTANQSLFLSFMNGYDLELSSQTGNFTLRQNSAIVLTTSAGGAVNIVGSTPQSFTNFAYLNTNGATAAYSGTPINKAVSLTAAQAIVAAEFDAVSDARLKTDILTLPEADALRFVRESRPVRFRFKADDPSVTRYGYLAQDIAKSDFSAAVSAIDCDDDAIQPGDDPHLYPARKKLVLGMDSLIPVHGAALKAALATIDTLRTRIDTLEARLAHDSV